MTAAMVAALRARLDALAERVDVLPLLDDDAARQARALVAALPPENGDADADPATLEALRIAALVHWHRHCLRGEDPGQPGDGDESENEGEVEDFAEAVALFSRVHRHDPLAVPDPLLPLIDTSGTEGKEEGPVTWNSMAQPYLDRYERTGDSADLRTAVQLLSAALDAAPEESPNRPLIVGRFARALLSLYEDTADERALTVCTDTARAETRLTHTVDRGVAWAILAAALFVRFDREMDPAVLEEAVQAARQAVKQTPTGAPDYPMRLHTLGDALLGSYEYTGDPRALLEAVRTAREAVELVPEGDAYRVVVLTSLATGLQEFFDGSGDRAALFEAVNLWRRILNGLPFTHPGRPAAVAQISAALWKLHQHTGASATLAEAIEHARIAVKLTLEDDQDRPGRMSNLAAMLRARFLTSGTWEDLHEVIGLLREAITLLPPGHPERAAQFGNLGNALRSRHNLTGDPSDLAKAIKYARMAVELTPEGHPARPAYLGNLAAILRAHYESDGHAPDLDEAITLLQTAVEALPHDHPGQATQLANLGNALSLRHNHSTHPQDADTGRQALWAAATRPAAPPLIRTRAAWAYGNASRQDGDTAEAVKGFQLAVELLPRIAPPSLGRDDREHRLGQLAGLGSEAAAAALDAGRPELALELLEQARGILLGEVLTARGELEELAAREPVLRARFQQLRDALSASEADTDTRLSIGMRFEETIAQVRALPGFGRFLLPPTVDDLRPDVDDGLVVVVNVAGHRSDALVLGADSYAEPRVVSLPDLTPERVAAHVDDFLSAIVPRTAADLRRPQPQAAQTLAWLWDAVVGPVLENLGITGPAAQGVPWPRVWWCPVGPLASLPLHAAGRHEGNGDSALDRVVSSYTPTVQALVAGRSRARHEPPDLAGRRGALVVAMPDTPGAPYLPYAQKEAESVARMMPETTLLADGQASRAAVLAELDRYPVLHFACHGVTDWQNPSANRLLLEDGALSVRDLLSHQLDGTQLVVLSACSTSTVGGGPSDEAVHLASSFLAAGATHVVGTLWAIEDRVAAQTATTLYSNLTTEGTLSPRTGLTALALHEATRQLREQYPGRPGLWASFVHVGV
ncbi:CHAT domain-containing protein [Streptomyces sp. NPDC060187]|uniref:CHAT domain-containing protein n=1 Tax=Streptomyces sp. NPDC060187 TaxID=3347067 RepID=UPI003665DC78